MATALLIIHGLVAVALLGAITHQTLATWVPARERPGSFFGRFRAVPSASFGNSTGDKQMLEYTKAGDGARLAMLVLHDDAKREYAYGPAQGLPATKVGTFTQAL